MHNPIHNKGTAWPLPERDRLGVRGLVPPTYATLKEQQHRVLSRLKVLQDPIEKFEILSALQDRNEVLFYSILKDYIKEIAPIIYTPTVGEVCKNFSALFRRARGMYFSTQDIGQMNAMVYNWPQDDVDVIVVTDGSRVLGLGIVVGGEGV
uniref:Malic enzyme N-terminal domain-containing protein n=1 Tax=Arcella intermedia TaxID=1963864 RepID=A0A6B2LNW2_9EUKA